MKPIIKMTRRKEPVKPTSRLSRKKLPWTAITIIFLVSATIVTMINPTSASPETFFHVEPPEVRDVQPNQNFTIAINVTDAPPSYSWEFHLSWDPALLNVSDIEEGDWLHRWTPNPFPPPPAFPKYTTNIAYEPFDEANVDGMIRVYCTLVANLSMDEWASGDGWLVTLNFTVKAEGSSPLNLYRTRLWDHFEAGYPVETYYMNEDGFFYNVAFHDIAITNVIISTTDVMPGEPVDITVTVKNEGNFTETFNVTVYADVIAYNMTLDIFIGDEITVGTQTGITLDAENSTTLPTLTWNTSGVAGETYTISANATVTSSVDDDPSDNTFIDDTVTVAWDHDLKIVDVTVLTP
ncbi:MAG: hypothetical protein GTO14_01085, partial [Anaerolineales bacterium]|nr:hypothetical protein [Anaerolineales bacterium]